VRDARERHAAPILRPGFRADLTLSDPHSRLFITGKRSGFASPASFRDGAIFDLRNGDRAIIEWNDAERCARASVRNPLRARRNSRETLAAGNPQLICNRRIICSRGFPPRATHPLPAPLLSRVLPRRHSTSVLRSTSLAAPSSVESASLSCSRRISPHHSPFSTDDIGEMPMNNAPLVARVRRREGLLEGKREDW